MMPQRCCGLADPAGGAPRPCVFAADGAGGPSKIGRRRDGPRCPFCCPEAFGHAASSPQGKGHITARLQHWREKGSPVYEAAFTFGILGLLLPLDAQNDFRRRAGESPRFSKATSWAHKQKARLHVLLRGKPIPAAPQLCGAGREFLCECRWSKGNLSVGQRWLPWVRELRYHIRNYEKYRGAEPAASRKWRRAWWRLRRELRRSLLPAVAKGKPYPAAVAWAAAEGIVDVEM